MNNDTKTNPERKNIVAVYGTLRRPFHNHGLLEHVGYDHVGDGQTQDQFALMVHGLPYLFKQPAISQITVEVYAVDNQGLRALDRLEQHPDWYKREKTAVKLENGETVDAWIYFQSKGAFDESLSRKSGNYVA